MSRPGMSSRDIRALSVGTALILSIAGVGRGIPAARGWSNSVMAAAGEQRNLLRRYEHGVAALSTIRDSVAKVERAAAAAERFLIHAPDVNGAAARLASLVERIANDQSVEVGGVTVQSDSVRRTGLWRVSVRVSAAGDVGGLSDLLYALESADVPIAIREFAVSQSEPFAAPTRAEALRFDMLLETLAVIGGSEASRSR